MAEKFTREEYEIYDKVNSCLNKIADDYLGNFVNECVTFTNCFIDGNFVIVEWVTDDGYTNWANLPIEEVLYDDNWVATKRAAIEKIKKEKEAKQKLENEKKEYETFLKLKSKYEGNPNE